jgi:hypothetical protein
MPQGIYGSDRIDSTKGCPFQTSSQMSKIFFCKILKPFKVSVPVEYIDKCHWFADALTIIN